MTYPPTGPAGLLDDVLDVPLDPALAERLDLVGLPILIEERTAADWARAADVLDDPAAVASRACYAAWLRRQAATWTAVRLPAVHVAALDWPLASVRPQCLDVVGLIIADLRELCPRNRPVHVPAQAWRDGPTPQGAVIAAALLCHRVATATAGLLGPAEALSTGLTAQGPATRYLRRCTDLAERGEGLDHEVSTWATTASPGQVHQAVLSARLFTARLADALEASTRGGW